MAYTLKQLLYIDVAARHGSITRASKELNISPSSISAAIDVVEQNSNRTLFSRLPSKGITPTRFGLTFLSHARELLHANNKFEDALLDQKQKISGTIRMGCFTPAAPILLPLVARTIADNHPDVVIEFSEGDAHQIYEMLMASDIDVAFAYQSAPPHPYIDFHPLFEAPPHIVLPSEHALAKSPSLSLTDVYQEPMILLDLNQTRDYMFALFAQDDLTPRIAYSSKSAEMVRSMVAAGLGYSIFNLRPLLKQQYVVGDLVRIPIDETYNSVTFGIMVRSDARLSRVDQVMIDTCLNLVRNGAFDAATLPKAPIV
jgi:DNA-binding transcriptional LysR family regulator